MTTLVIAFGNSWRGDDGLGPAAGARIAAWSLPGVEIAIVPQLVPELIDRIRLATRVLFVDAAAVDAIDGPYSLARIAADQAPAGLGHLETPAHLLGLLHALDGRIPEPWLLAIAGSAFAFGPGLSEAAAANLTAALARLRGWLET